MPIYAWSMLVVALMIVFAFPAVIPARRCWNSSAHSTGRSSLRHVGGDPLLWQHLFWFFGHPEVYIIFLPAAGMVSMMIPTMAQTRSIGYRTIVVALIGVGVFSFALWAHHMFTSRTGRDGIEFCLRSQHGGCGADGDSGLFLDRDACGAGRERFRIDDRIAVPARLPVHFHPWRA
jgi:cytochrome c oxidase subunit I+III